MAQARSQGGPWVFTGATIGLAGAFMGMASIVGADCLWLVALGDHVLRGGGLPDGLPFAAAPSDGWPNVLLLAEVLLALVHRAGVSALAATQVAVDLVVLGLLAWGARKEGASDRATALVLALVAAGAITSFVVVRVQLFSLVPFVLLALLLRAEHRRPSRRIWLLLPLVVVWSNLHGAVLLGVCVAGTYLVFSRLRTRVLETVAVGAATLAALLVTPVGPRTVPYYLGVMDNEAAARGSELWARPDLTEPFDILLAVAALVLVALMARTRRPLWEWVAVLALLVGTATAARHGVWLLMLASAPAALGLTRSPAAPGPFRPKVAPVVVAALAFAAMVALPVTRGDQTTPADPALVRLVADRAGDQVVLAPEPLVESLAVAGVTVWLSDPVDAFARPDQAAYLDFLDGISTGQRALDASDLVVVRDGSPPQRLVERDGGWSEAALLDDWLLYTRR